MAYDEMKQEAANSLTYFWQEKGDLERCASFDGFILYFPQLKEAWNAYKRAERLVDLEVKELANEDVT